MSDCEITMRESELRASIAEEVADATGTARARIDELEQANAGLQAHLDGRATKRALFIDGVDCSPQNVHDWINHANELKAQLAKAEAEILRLRQQAGEMAQELEQRRNTVARVDELFALRPDTSIRTTWHDGVEHWEVPADEMREAMGVKVVHGPEATS